MSDSTHDGGPASLLNLSIAAANELRELRTDRNALIDFVDRYAKDWCSCIYAEEGECELCVEVGKFLDKVQGRAAP